MRHPSALIHVNAGGTFGLGHLMRGITLAEEAASRGWQVQIGGQLDPGAIAVLHTFLPGVKPMVFQADIAPHRLRQAISELRPDVLHLDTYWLSNPDVPRGPHLVSSMHDGPHGPVTADLDIDATLGAERYPVCSPASRLHLLGLDAAPIRRQVRQQQATGAGAAPTPRVLVVLGGTDPHGLAKKVVQALLTIQTPIAITAVVPRRDHESLQASATSTPHDLQLATFLTNLPSVAASQDLVVSAAGTSVWDYACQGVATALVSVTENQERGYSEAVAAGLGLGLGEPPHLDLGERVRGLERLLLARDQLRSCGREARAKVDGLGAWRIVSAWEQLMATPPIDAPSEGIDVRLAQQSDAQSLFEWRNDPATRRASLNREPVTWRNHVEWLRSSLSNPDRVLLMATLHDNAIGTVRWDRRGELDWEISITLAPSARGRGLALPVLRAGQNWPVQAGNVRLLASVRASNLPSKRLFEQAGYLSHLPPDDDGVLTLARWRV